MTVYEQVEFDGRADWLAKRRTGVGASDIPAVMGISPYSTIFQTWVSKMSDDAPEVEQTEQMMWGLKVEGLILDEFEERTGLTVGERGFMWRNAERPWMLATPDGLGRVHDSTFDCVVDAKKSDDWNWDEPPAHYVAQIQWQLATTGYGMGYLAVLHRGQRLEIHPIEADPELQSELIEAGEAFWDLVESGVPPPVGGDDNVFMASLYPSHVEEAVEISSEMASELYEARLSVDEAKAQLATAEAAIKEALGTSDTAVVDQDVICTWRTQVSRRTDVKRLKAGLPEVAAEYVTDACHIEDCKVEGKHSHSRVLRVKEPKT